MIEFFNARMQEAKLKKKKKKKKEAKLNTAPGNPVIAAQIATNQLGTEFCLY